MQTGFATPVHRQRVVDVEVPAADRGNRGGESGPPLRTNAMGTLKMHGYFASSIQLKHEKLKS